MSSSFLSASEVQHLQKLLNLAHLEIHARPNWGSHNPGYREEIHGVLKEKMSKAYPFSDSSISHCRTLGGFAFTAYDSDHVVQLGFDIEEDSRVSEVVAARICKNPQEMSEAPSPASLWTAKEAAFKALKGPKQPKVVSDLEFCNWRVIDSQIETVQLKNPSTFSFNKIFGVLFKKKPYTFALFISLP